MFVIGILAMLRAVVNSSPEFAIDFAGELDMKEKELFSVCVLSEGLMYDFYESST